MSRYYAARGCAVDACRILLTASTSEAYAYLFKLLADPGDQVLTPRPLLSAVRISRQHGIARAAPVSAAVLRWLDHRSACARSGRHLRTRAVVLVNPNNPTGSYVKRAELAALTQLAAARGLALISDEVFSDYAFARRCRARGHARRRARIACRFR